MRLFLCEFLCVGLCLSARLKRADRHRLSMHLGDLCVSENKSSRAIAVKEAFSIHFFLSLRLERVYRERAFGTCDQEGFGGRIETEYGARLFLCIAVDCMRHVNRQTLAIQ